MINQLVKVLTERQYDSFPAGKLIARQGDVLLFKPHGKVPVGNKLKDGDKHRLVLAHGEVTGHAHAFYTQEVPQPVRAKAFELFECEASDHCFTTLPGRHLRLNTRSFLRHEEHTAFSLPPRDYIVVIQHEGSELEELRRVAD